MGVSVGLRILHFRGQKRTQDFRDFVILLGFSLLARIARADVFRPDEIAIVRAMNRTVRRCFLMSDDPLTVEAVEPLVLSRLSVFLGCCNSLGRLGGQQNQTLVFQEVG